MPLSFLGSKSRAFSARAIRILRFSTPPLLLKFLYHRFSHKLFRLQIDVKMEIPHSLRRGRPGWPRSLQADLSRIIIEFEKISKKASTPFGLVKTIQS